MNEPHDIPVSYLQISQETNVNVLGVGYQRLGTIRYVIILMDISFSNDITVQVCALC